jgi:hypothetical protein
LGPRVKVAKKGPTFFFAKMVDSGILESGILYYSYSKNVNFPLWQNWLKKMLAEKLFLEKSDKFISLCLGHNFSIINLALS